MNLFKWLKNKTGKVPVSVVQAAGITAVVGAAGFAAMSYLNTPTDNSAFIPPSAYESREVVYVNRGGGDGSYESNGALRSTFQAAPSRSIQLANRQAERERQARLLESQGGDSYQGSDEDEVNIQMPKAYQLSGGNLGIGLGGGTDKDTGGSMDALSNIQGQLAGLGNMLNNAAGGAMDQAAAKEGKGAGGKAPGTKPAALASASHDWSNGGLTRAGGGSGTANSFVIQDSGKNPKGANAAPNMANLASVMNQAQSALASANMKEGSRMQAARFGPSAGLGKDKDALVKGGGRRQDIHARNELEAIRKHTARVHSLKNPQANAGMSPFLANATDPAGLVVSDDAQVTTQQQESRGVKSTSHSQMRGVGSHLDSTTAANMDEMILARDTLKEAFWKVFPAAMAGILAIGILVALAKVAGPWAWAFWAAAGILSAVILSVIWFGLSPVIKKYVDVCGADGWSSFGWALSGVLTAGVGLAWILPKAASKATVSLIQVAGIVAGFGGAGYSALDMLKNRDEYKRRIEQSKEGTSQMEQEVQEMEQEAQKQEPPVDNNGKE